MHSQTIRSFAAASLSIVASALLWLMFVTTATPHSIAYAAPDGGVATNCTEAGLDAALTGGGSISFNCGANPVTITVTSSKVISINTTIDGGGKITLSGGDASKVFLVNSGIRLTLNNITVAHGNSALGGCVTVQSTLDVTNATFNHCVSHSTLFFPGAGGAIPSLNGTVALTNSVVSNNSVDLNGGGIFLSGGQATLNHVDVLSNTAATAAVFISTTRRRRSSAALSTTTEAGAMAARLRIT